MQSHFILANVTLTYLSFIAKYDTIRIYEGQEIALEFRVYALIALNTETYHQVEHGKNTLEY